MPRLPHYICLPYNDKRRKFLTLQCTGITVVIASFCHWADSSESRSSPRLIDSVEKDNGLKCLKYFLVLKVEVTSIVFLATNILYIKIQFLKNLMKSLNLAESWFDCGRQVVTTMHANVNIKHVKIDTSVFQCLEKKDREKRYGKNHMEPKVVDKETGKEDHTLSLKREVVTASSLFLSLSWVWVIV